MVSAPKKNHSPLPAGEYGKSTKLSTWGPHQSKYRNGGLEAETVLALRALCSLRSKYKIAQGKGRETHFLSNEEKEKWIEDYSDWATAVVSNQLEDAETAIEHEQKDIRNAEKPGLTTRKSETTYQYMLNAIGDSLSDVASQDARDDGNDEDDEEENAELGQLNDNDEPG